MTERRLVRALRAMADVDLGRQRSPDRDQGPNMVPYLRAANVKDGRLILDDVMEMDFSPSEQQTFGLAPGDVLVSEGAGSLTAVGASAVWSGEIPGVIGYQNTLLRLRPRPGNDARYLMWWARHAYGSGLFASIATGANIYHLGAERVRLLPSWTPPLPHQRAIASYLDTETARIDAVVAARVRQGELLEQRRRAFLGAVMTGRHAATERLLVGRPSRPLRVFADVDLGRARSPESAIGPNMVRYLRAANVKNGYLALDEVSEMNFTPSEQRGYALVPGDVLVTEGAGSLTAVGANAVWNGELGGTVCFQNHLLRIRAGERADKRFIAWWARFAYESGLFASLATGAQILNLGAENVRRLPVLMPDLDGQAWIADLLDERVESIETAMQSLARQLTLLRERRQGLITAAVTGQLDIPGLAE